MWAYHNLSIFFLNSKFFLFGPFKMCFNLPFLEFLNRSMNKILFCGFFISLLVLFFYFISVLLLFICVFLLMVSHLLLIPILHISVNIIYWASTGWIFNHMKLIHEAFTLFNSRTFLFQSCFMCVIVVLCFFFWFHVSCIALVFSTLVKWIYISFFFLGIYGS